MLFAFFPCSLWRKRFLGGLFWAGIRDYLLRFDGGEVKKMDFGNAEDGVDNGESFAIYQNILYNFNPFKPC